MGTSLVAIAGTVSAVISAVVTAVVTVIVTKRPAQVTADAAAITASAAFQEALNDGFSKLDAAWERRVTALENEIRGLSRHVENLENILRDNGLPIPARAASLDQGKLALVGGREA